MSPVLAPAESDPPTDSELLDHAADLLATVVGRPPVLVCDLHTALLEAVRRCGGGEDRYTDLRLATRAVDGFLTYLRGTGQVPPGVRAGQALRGWLRGREPAGVRRALTAAADGLRHRAALLDPYWMAEPRPGRPGRPPHRRHR